MKLALNPRGLDVAALARTGQACESAVDWRELERLSASCLAGPPAGLVAWTASASRKAVVGSEPELRLTLGCRCVVFLQCQRCLQSVEQLLEVQRRFRFVDDEASAQALDEGNDDEDVLALRGRLDLIELLEDELILALPLVPRHERCPQPLAAGRGRATPGADQAAAAANERHRPFEALAQLKSRR
jgi:uncharacterized protein